MTMTLPSGGPARAGLAAPGPAAHGACPRGLAAPGGQEAALAGTAGADGAGPGLLELAGDEARLPAGSKLADERAAARRCFVILDGQASVERAGARCRGLGRSRWHWFANRVSASRRDRLRPHRPEPSSLRV